MNRRNLTRGIAVVTAALLLGGCLHIERIDGVETEPTPPPVTLPETSAPETEPPETDAPVTPETEPAPETPALPVFTLEELQAANLLSTLLETHDSVTVREDFPDARSFFCVFKRGGDRVFLNGWGDWKTESFAALLQDGAGGNYRGLDFAVYPQDWPTAYAWIVTRQPEEDVD